MYLHGLQFFSEQRELTRIGLAEAPLDDPLDWRMVSEELLIDLGGEGATDSHMAAYPWVVRIADIHWHLYYAAWDGSFVPHAPAPEARPDLHGGERRRRLQLGA